MKTKDQYIALLIENLTVAPVKCFISYILDTTAYVASIRIGLN